MALDPASRVQEMLARSEKSLRDKVLAAILDAASSNAPQILNLVSLNKVEDALKLVTEDITTRISNDFTQEYMASGQATSAFLATTVGIRIGFDQTNERAVRNIQRNKLEFVQQFSQQQRHVTHLALQDGVRRGLNPRDQARNFRQSIGLTLNQQQWVINYRNALERSAAGDTSALRRRLRDARFDRSVRGAARGTRAPLTPDEIDRMVTRYTERAVKYRSEVIARTEALKAVNMGQDEMYRQAIASGRIHKDSLNRKWVAARDERVRGTHKTLNGQVRKIDQKWTTPYGSLRFPGDPQAPAREIIQCRCTLATRFKPVRPAPAPVAAPPPVTGPQIFGPQTQEEWDDGLLGDKAQARFQEYRNLPDFFDGDKRNDGLQIRDPAWKADAGIATAWTSPNLNKRIREAIQEGLSISPADNRVIKSISKAAQPLSKPIVTFRGMDIDPDKFNFKAGDTLAAAFPASTSYSLGTAKRYSRDNVLMQVQSKPGARAFVFNENEAEALYPAGTVFKVLSVEDGPNFGPGNKVKKLVRVEALSPDEADAVREGPVQPKPKKKKPALLKDAPKTSAEWGDWHSGERRTRRNQRFSKLPDYYDRHGEFRNDGLHQRSEQWARDAAVAQEWIRDSVYHRIRETVFRGDTLSRGDQDIVDSVRRAATPLSRRMVTFRGIGLQKDQTTFKRGEIITAPIPTSTSYDLSIAEGFSRNDTLWQIHSRPGAKAFIYNNGEKEVLYPAGTRFRIVRTVKDFEFESEFLGYKSTQKFRQMVVVEALAPGDID